VTRLLLTCDPVGGVWQYATDLAAALVPHGVEPILATLGPPPSAAQRGSLVDGVRLVETGLPLDWVAGSSRDAMKAGVALARLADRVQADIVQLNAPSLAAGASFSQPVVTVAHSCVGTWWQAVKGGRADPDMAWRIELTRSGLRAADRVVCPSGAFATALQHCYQLPSTPTVVRNGRRPAEVSPRPIEDHALTAGRLWDAGKNLRALDEAASLLSVPLRAAGAIRGPHGEQIVLRHVRQLGTLDDQSLADALACRPVFVSAAVYEPFGLAVLEAAQAGCALVLSDIPTFRELWDGAARFVYPHDATGFARAIEDLIADGDLRAQLGAAAQRRSQDYTTARMAAGMLALYGALPAPSPELAAA
jgi:glycosyltransferase involved in cell wall biosynthesis